MATGPVLLVEDDPTLVGTLTRNLVARGYRTRSAMSVAAALDAIADERPGLVLLDIDLPDGSGWDVPRALRKAGHTDVPVIVLSALRPNPRLCAEFEAAGVLEKPFPMEALLRQVATLMGRAATPAAADDGVEG